MTLEETLATLREASIGCKVSLSPRDQQVLAAQLFLAHCENGADMPANRPTMAADGVRKVRRRRGPNKPKTPSVGATEAKGGNALEGGDA